MARTTRIGKNYRVLIAPELTYGVVPTTGFIELSDAINFNQVVNPIETSYKTGTLKKQKYETLAGNKTVSLTMEGNFSPSHSVMLDAVMFDTSSPRTLQDTQPGQYSYSIFRVYTDDERYDIVSGCTAEALTINGTSGDLVKYNTTFRGKDISREIASGSGSFTLSKCAPIITPFNFADVTADLIDSNVSSFNSFELTINNEFQGDTETYQNNDTKQLETLIGISSELKFNWNYDRNIDIGVYDEILSSTLVENTINLISASGSFGIEAKGKYMTYDLPDPDAGLFVSDATMTILSDCDTTEGLTITTL